MLYYFTESLSPESLSGCESSSSYSSELIIIRARPISDLSPICYKFISSNLLRLPRPRKKRGLDGKHQRFMANTPSELDSQKLGASQKVDRSI